ncbi:hypothetical protein GCM10027037_05570 [Mucilaginibacter koreensis]
MLTPGKGSLLSSVTVPDTILKGDVAAKALECTLAIPTINKTRKRLNFVKRAGKRLGVIFLFISLIFDC